MAFTHEKYATAREISLYAEALRRSVAREARMQAAAGNHHRAEKLRGRDPELYNDAQRWAVAVEVGGEETRCPNPYCGLDAHARGSLYRVGIDYAQSVIDDTRLQRRLYGMPVGPVRAVAS